MSDLIEEDITDTVASDNSAEQENLAHDDETSAQPIIEEPIQEIDDKAPELEAIEIPNAKESEDPSIIGNAFSGSEFFSFIQREIIDFINIVNIENEHERRASVIALELGESGLKDRIHLAESFLRLLKEASNFVNSSDAFDYYLECHSKLETLKKWLGI